MSIPFEAQNATAIDLSFCICSRLEECFQVINESEWAKKEQLTSFGKDYRYRAGRGRGKGQKVQCKFLHQAWGLSGFMLAQPLEHYSMKYSLSSIFWGAHFFDSHRNIC